MVTKNKPKKSPKDEKRQAVKHSPALKLFVYTRQTHTRKKMPEIFLILLFSDATVRCPSASEVKTNDTNVNTHIFW